MASGLSHSRRLSFSRKSRSFSGSGRTPSPALIAASRWTRRLSRQHLQSLGRLLAELSVVSHSQRESNQDGMLPQNGMLLHHQGSRVGQTGFPQRVRDGIQPFRRFRAESYFRRGQEQLLRRSSALSFCRRFIVKVVDSFPVSAGRGWIQERVSSAAIMTASDHNALVPGLVCTGATAGIAASFETSIRMTFSPKIHCF